MLGYINGKVARPKENVKTEHARDTEAWVVRSDLIVKSWILGSITEQITIYVVDRLIYKFPNADFTAKDVWDELQYKITNNGYTILHIAVNSGKNHELLELLLGQIPVNQQLVELKNNSDGSTLLHVAAIVGNTKAVNILAARDRDLLIAKDNKDQTPLAISLSNMHTETSWCLLNHVNTRTEKNTLFAGANGDNLLVLAISSKEFAWPFVRRRVADFDHSKEVLTTACEMICSSIDPSSHHLYFTNPLFEAIRQDAIEVAKEILYKFPDAVWSVNEDGHNIIQLRKYLQHSTWNERT
ncbi:ankyrin repeat-containing domain, PGG domain protein [Artemisia annua]|uniref:Ankyrin repeat-containing domain, PGG domain protein n=1 Tax=Artemisia annua TaxID=35608 RepID=A0A2U1NNQ6_ARTAN|nr:ankyrin repeat-containing domain, PGG domain protein [Artemisia annua]